MNWKKACIRTFGCQMNDHDSSRMREILKREGYKMIPDPQDADLVLINTCSVRGNPENKVYSKLGQLRAIKAKKPDLIIGVGGCVAPARGRKDPQKRKVCRHGIRNG